MTAQPDTVQRNREERFRWDEENRLTALSQNGYVSHYWYDADGERIYHDRVIDIDILLYGNRKLETPDLTIPHPQLDNRPFFKELIAQIKQNDSL